MKLHNGFITYDADGEQIMVAAGAASSVFRGMVRSNSSAAFIIDFLKNETTREAILDAMCARYEAPRDVIARDVDKILDSLRKIGALDE